MYLVPRLSHSRDEKHLVVHREPEQHREEEDRNPGLDLRELVQACEGVADAPLEEDDEHPVARGDGQEIQEHRLQRQDDGTEGAHQHEVRQDEHGEDEPRKDRVRPVDEIHALRRTAAGEHAHVGRESRPGDDRAAQARHEFLRRLVAVLVTPGDDHLRVPSARIDEPSTVPELDELDLGVLPHGDDQPSDRRLDPRLGHRPARARVDDDLRRRQETRPFRVAEDVEPAYRLRRLRDSLCGAGRQLQREDGHGGGQKHADPGRERRDRPAHDRRRQARPHSVLVVRADHARQRQSTPPKRVCNVHARGAAPPVEREQRRLQRCGGEDRHERDQEATDAHRAHERHRHEQEQRETDRDRGPGEHDRAAGGGHRPEDCVVGLAAARELFTEPIDDEERVVDRDPEPDQLHEVRHVRRHRHVVRDDVHDPERAGNRRGGEQERDRRCE